MANYVEQDLNLRLPGQPWTSAKAIADAENLLAVAEGAPGAPVIAAAWHPYDATSNEQSSGVIYDHDVDGDETEVITPNFSDDDFEYKIIWEQIAGKSTSTQNPNTGLWSLFLSETSEYTIAGVESFSVINVTLSSGFILIQPQKIARNLHLIKSESIARQVNINSELQGYSENAKSFSRINATRITRARLAVSGAGIGGGKIYMFKRRVEGF